MTKRTIAHLFVAVFVAWHTRHVVAADSTAPNLKSLCEKVKPAYVFISGGSGVIIRPDGLMLTNAHVIGNEKKFDIRTGEGRYYRANLLGSDPFGDLAALKLELKPDQQVPFLELGDSEALKIGDFALATGNPFGLGVVDQTPTFTLGVISALHSFQGRYTECIVTDAEVNPGNSGGPLVNQAGQVVGINGQISTRWGLRSNTGLGYAISARQIKFWLPKLEMAEGKNVEHGHLSGLSLQTDGVDLMHAVVVNDVGEETPAGVGGFQKGDTIIRVDGFSTPNLIRLHSVLGVYPTDQEVNVDVRRADKEVPLKVKLTTQRRGKLGMKVTAPEGEGKNAVVTSVEADSAAAKAGIQVGDEVIGIGEHEFKESPNDQVKLLEGWMRGVVHAGDIVHLKMRRKNEQGEPTARDVRIVAR